MRALLDVNVLIALLDSQHTFHRSATNWLELNLQHGWASCPITQNGCIRILSQSSYPNSTNATAVAAFLKEAISGNEHEFWPDDINLAAVEIIDWRHILGSRQVTDAYLLALAVKHNGKFVSFDQNVSLATVMGASKRHMEILK